MPTLPSVCIMGKLEYTCVVKYQTAGMTVVIPACQTPIKGKLKENSAAPILIISLGSIFISYAH